MKHELPVDLSTHYSVLRGSRYTLLDLLALASREKISIEIRPDASVSLCGMRGGKQRKTRVSFSRPDITTWSNMSQQGMAGEQENIVSMNFESAVLDIVTTRRTPPTGALNEHKNRG